jgi:hypothetical protein
MPMSRDGPSLYAARPTQISDPAGLACHSEPRAAPATLLKTDGKHGAFGGQANELLGAQAASDAGPARAHDVRHSVGALAMQSAVSLGKIAPRIIEHAAAVGDRGLTATLSKRAAGEATAREHPGPDRILTTALAVRRRAAPLALRTASG